MICFLLRFSFLAKVKPEFKIQTDGSQQSIPVSLNTSVKAAI